MPPLTGLPSQRSRSGISGPCFTREFRGSKGTNRKLLAVESDSKMSSFPLFHHQMEHSFATSTGIDLRISNRTLRRQSTCLCICIHVPLPPSNLQMTLMLDEHVNPARKYITASPLFQLHSPAPRNHQTTFLDPTHCKTTTNNGSRSQIRRPGLLGRRLAKSHPHP